MEMIISYIHQGFSFIVPLVILLGLLIFVHELGHFLVAKYFGVRVETFSLGFGKKIWSHKKGDTVYCLSIIPFGGYVKMFGDEPNSEISESEKAFAFNTKPIGQRIAVVLAGPLMNFFFAILLFTVIAVVGEETVLPMLGDVAIGTQAYNDGFRTGDRILKINDQKMVSWDDVQNIIESHKNESLKFDVERDGTPTQIAAQTQSVANKNILSSDALVGEIEGFSYTSTAGAVGIISQQSAAYKAGLRLGDRISAVDGIETNKYSEVLTAIKNSNQKNVQLKIQPADEKKPAYTIDLSKTQNDPQVLLKSFGIESAELYVEKATDSSPAAKAGVLPSDKLVAINDKKISSWQEIVNTIQAYKANDPALKVTVLREGKEKTFSITPELISQPTQTGKEKKVYALGIATAMVIAPPSTFVMKNKNPLKAVYIGISKTLYWSKATIMSFVRLIENKVSPKSLGGPIMIGQLASKTFQIGLSPFLKIMAIISINLFVLNLLPVPVLDGGHLFFYAIELIKGSPLSMRKMEIAQQIGLVLLLSLMVFAVFNDVTRLFQ